MARISLSYLGPCHQTKKPDGARSSHGCEGHLPCQHHQRCSRDVRDRLRVGQAKENVSQLLATFNPFTPSVIINIYLLLTLSI